MIIFFLQILGINQDNQGEEKEIQKQKSVVRKI